MSRDKDWYYEEPIPQGALRMKPDSPGTKAENYLLKSAAKAALVKLKKGDPESIRNAIATLEKVLEETGLEV